MTDEMVHVKWLCFGAYLGCCNEVILNIKCLLIALDLSSESAIVSFTVV